MTSDVCIVTTYKREELLWLCLEAIRKDDADIPIYVFSDRNADSPDLSAVLSEFMAWGIIRRAHNNYGNSFNLLEACRCIAGWQNPPEIIHLIEDDTIIHAGYLEWARRQLLTHQYAAVCGRIDSPHINSWYESPCASWLTSHLKDALAHLVPEYFTENREGMQRILDEVMFPNSQYKKGGAEQDGFFLRCIEFHLWKTKFPPKPLATHLGWWGYNSPSGREAPTGKFEDRIWQCREMLKNKPLRRELFGHRIVDAEWEGMGL